MLCHPGLLFAPLGFFKQWSKTLQAGNYLQCFYKKRTYNTRLIIYFVSTVKKPEVNKSDVLSRSKYCDRAVTIVIKQSLHSIDYYNSVISLI